MKNLKNIPIELNDFFTSTYTCQHFMIFDMINDPLLLLDETGVVLFMNDKARKFYGMSIDQARKLHISAFDLNMSSSAEHLHIIRHAGEDGHIFLSTHQKRNKELAPVQIHARCIKLNGKSTFVLVIKDISLELKLKQEFEFASRIQEDMLPRPYQGQLLSIQTIYRPYNYVSGDFYSYKWVNEHLLSGYLLDIMGHGLATALIISALRVLLSQALDQKLPLHEQMAWLNQQAIPYFADDSFAAMLCFSLDFEKQQLTYSTAGINYFLATRHGRPRIIKNPGFFIGLDKSAEYESHTLTFHSGDTFAFMSDGLFELLPQPEEFCPSNAAESYRWLTKLSHSRKRRDDISALFLSIK